MENSVVKSLDLKFNYTSPVDQVLIDLWRITSNGLVNSQISSTERICNRSWRLLNKIIISKVDIDTTSSQELLLKGLRVDSLSEIKPSSSQSMSKRPSLFSNNSRSTLFSHNSSLAELKGNLRPEFEDDSSSDDISDISEENESNFSDDNSEHEWDEKSPEISNEKNINNEESAGYFAAREDISRPITRSRTSFVRGFSPNHISINSMSSSMKNQPSTSTFTDSNNNVFKKKSSKNIFFLSNSHSPPGPLDQLVESGSGNFNLSTRQISHFNHENFNTPVPIKRQDSLFGNSNFNLKDIPKQSVDAGYSSTDISEDDSDNYGSNDEEDQISDVIELKDSRIPGKKEISTNSSTKTFDNDSEWISVSSDEGRESDKDIPPLQFQKWTSSGSKTLPISVNSATNSNDISDNNISSTFLKPRSLLSGLLLNEMITEGTSDNVHNPDLNPKPILKRSSTTGIITVHQNFNNKSDKPSILFSKKHNSFSDISRNYPHYQNETVKRNILNEYSTEKDNGGDDHGVSVLGKQKSIVGISDFNVTTRSRNNLAAINNNNFSSRLNNRADPQYLTADIRGNSNMNNHDLLSSSLNKYSKSASSNSLKNLLSKSSLSLSNLFHSKSKFARADSPQNLKSGNSNTTKADSTASFVTQNNDNNANNEMENIKIEIDMKHVKDDLASNLIDIKDSTNDLKQNQPVKFLISLSPKSTRKSMLSTELSESLKESIIIDYKLGKVPLPSKVFDKNEFLKSEEVINNEIDDGDDYHSKGW